MGNILKKLLHYVASRGELKDVYSNRTNISDEEHSTQNQLFMSIWWLNYVQSVLGIFLVTLMTKRKFCCRKCLNGYFGLAVPVNFLESRKQRRAFLAAFALCTVTVLQVLEELASGVTEIAPYYIKIIVKLIAIGIVSCQFLPLFAFIYMASMPGYIIGLIYQLFFLVFDILEDVPSPDVSVGTALKELTLRALITIIAGSYLVYWFVKQIIQQYQRRCVVKDIPKNQIKYVKYLLLPKERYLMAQTAAALKENQGNKFDLWIRKNVYRNVPGFRYSLTILVSCTVGFIGITHVFSIVFYSFIENLIEVLQLLDKFDNLKEKTVPNFVDMIIRYLTASDTTTNKQALFEKAGTISLYDFIYTQSIIIVVGSLLAGVVAYILGILSICHLLTSYRENVLNLSKRKERQAILHITKEFPNVALVVSAIQFGGFQVAYLMAGFGIQLFALTVLFLTFGEVIIIPIQFAFSSYLAKVAEIITPIAVALILIPLIQKLMVKYLFLENRGKTMALNNRRGFFIMTYVMFFYNIFSGAFSCTRRIIRGAVVGILLIPRLDRSIFPRTFENTDAAFRAYSCLLHLEALQSNPIVTTFVGVLTKKQSFRLINESQIYTERNALLYPKLPKLAQVSLNRWFVAYTMIRNPSIITFRGHLNMLSVIEVYSKPFSVESKTEVNV